MKQVYALYIIIIFLYCPAYAAKLIGLVPVRNEQVMITQCLKALSLYTDAIIVLDDYSTDNTVEIVQSLAQECNVVNILKKDYWYRDEPGDKNRLLQAGRDAGGTHFIVIDADEIPTANFLKDNLLRNTIFNMQPGDSLALCWIQLWRSVNQYRFDSSVWTWNYKRIIFADDGISHYTSDFIHTSAIPNNLQGKKYQVNGYEYGLLHFQFVNWRNLLVKQAWYRCLERIRSSNKSSREINQLYAPSKNEENIHLEAVNTAWFDGYNFFNASIFNQPEKWREKQVISWFKQYGKNYFKELDIWDIDWCER